MEMDKKKLSESLGVWEEEECFNDWLEYLIEVEG